MNFLSIGLNFLYATLCNSGQKYTTVYNVIKSMTKYKKDAKILERKNITKVCKHMQKV